MGSLRYPVSGVPPIRIDDRTLAHLQIVIGSKLRLQQSFFFSWIDDLASGGGRTSIWVDSTIPLTFVYTTNRQHQLNRKWLEALMVTANSVAGLHLIAEPETLKPVEKTDRSGVIAA